MSNKIKLNNVAKIQRQALQTLTEEEEEQRIRHRSRSQRDWEHKSKKKKKKKKHRLQLRCHCQSSVKNYFLVGPPFPPLRAKENEIVDLEHKLTTTRAERERRDETRRDESHGRYLIAFSSHSILLHDSADDGFLRRSLAVLVCGLKFRI